MIVGSRMAYASLPSKLNNHHILSHRHQYQLAESANSIFEQPIPEFFQNFKMAYKRIVVVPTDYLNSDNLRQVRTALIMQHSFNFCLAFY